MLFTVYFSLDGAPKTGLTPLLVLWEITEADPPTKSEISLVSPADEMTEIGNGAYSFYYSANNTKSYFALADADDGTMLGSEKYAPCISTVQGEVLDTKDVVESGTFGNAAIKTDTAAILVDTAEIDWTDIDFIMAIEGGRWDIVGNTMTFYDSDNVTAVASFALTGTAPDFTQRTRNP